MRYILWLWRNSCGIRWNTVVRIVTGIGQVVLGLLMVWFSRRFIDETIRTGTADDVLRMVELLVLTVVGGVVLRQVGYWLKTSANVRQSNALRLRIFGRLFHRQLFTGDELHSGDVSSRLAKDIEQVYPARDVDYRHQTLRRFPADALVRRTAGMGIAVANTIGHRFRQTDCPSVAHHDA